MQPTIALPNAGLVLINAYIPMLFERLGLIEDRQFTTSTNQTDAVHYLQYLVTGLEHTQESLLVLNKVLSGVEVSTPIENGISISEENKKLMDGLLDAVIGYWPALGNTTIDGFRGNWLVRDGVLTEQEDRWELKVEKKAYDLLIHKSPFSFSIIKLPWMQKPLHVEWFY